MPDPVIILRHPNYNIYPNGLNLGAVPAVNKKRKSGNSPLTSSELESRLFKAPNPESHKFRLKPQNLKQKTIDLRYIDSHLSEPQSTKWRYQYDFDNDDTDSD
jgi:hypothetical protein